MHGCCTADPSPPSFSLGIVGSNKVELGSVADWVQAIGGLAALAAALVVAFVEHLRARRAEAKESRRFQALLHEGMGQVDEIQHAFTRLFELSTDGRQLGYDAAFTEHETRVLEAGRKLSTLTGLASGEPSLALIFSDCAAAATPIGRGVYWQDAHEQARRNANDFMLHYKELAKMAGQADPERWLVDAPSA